MKVTLRLWHIVRSLLMVMSAGVALWLSANWPILDVALALWAIFWLVILRTQRSHRHQHIFTLAGAVLLSILFAVLLRWAADSYAVWSAAINASFGGLLQLINLSLPATIAGAVPLLNALFLVLCVLLKSVVITGLAYSGDDGASWAADLYSSAYRLRETRWLLKPWCIHARVFGPVLAILGTCTLGALRWVLDAGQAVPWIPLLLAAMLPIGIEWYFWLSGMVDDQLEPEFGGGEQNGRSSAVFDDLWQRYRQRWPEHWRAAGNRAPEQPHG